MPEPDPARAILVGAEDDSPSSGAAAEWYAPAEELLRTLPGIDGRNARFVMGKVGSVAGLCALSLAEVQEVLGVEPGRACWEFIHRGERTQGTIRAGQGNGGDGVSF